MMCNECGFTMGVLAKSRKGMMFVACCTDGCSQFDIEVNVSMKLCDEDACYCMGSLECLEEQE